METDRATRFSVATKFPFSAALWVVVGLLVLTACGGGGDEEGLPPDDGNVGAGWVKIEAATAGNTTESAEVTLYGSAFISPTRYKCCNASDPVGSTGVTVSWSNSTGAAGYAEQRITVGHIFGSPYLDGHYWRAVVPLVVGDNIITVGATDFANNSGRDKRTIKRLPDTVPPLVTGTNPADTTSGVPVNGSITVTFNEDLAPTSVASSITVVDNLGNPVGGNASYSNRVITFAPSTLLAGLTQYVATVTTSVRDTSGNALAAPHVWGFITGALPDTTPPTVISTEPASGEICAPSEGSILVAFDESVAMNTVNTNSFVLRDASNNLVNGSVSFIFDGRADFVPTNTLAAASVYKATLTTAITDLSGNGLASDYEWSFTTAAEIGSWTALNNAGAPAPRSYYSATWTGPEMIVWGGVSGFSGSPLQSGARYQLATDSWVPMSTVGAPEARSRHAAVWTGDKLIIWGGVRPGSFLGTGGIYDPATDTWTSMSTVGAPSPRLALSGVIWAGSEMIVWGGSGAGGNNIRDGARYNPSTDTWSPISTVGAPSARSGERFVWTGSRMIVWGGCCIPPITPYNDGAMYSPTTDTWTQMSQVGAPTARTRHSAVWTGTEMIVWGGDPIADGFHLNDGARFNPTTNTWQSIASTCAPIARADSAALWTGSEMIVWGGGLGGGVYFQVGGRYDPSTNTWRSMNRGSELFASSALWTGSEVLVWGSPDLLAALPFQLYAYRP